MHLKSDQSDGVRLIEHLAGMCRELIAVPHDRGMADGNLVTLNVLKPEIRCKRRLLPRLRTGTGSRYFQPKVSPMFPA